MLDTPKPGPPPGFGRKHVDRAIARLQALASEALADHVGRTEFERSVKEKRSWYVKKGKGHGFEQKRRSFKDWYAREIGGPPCIYGLWKNRACLYVGKTTNGAGRLTSYFEKAWFQSITRVDVYAPRGKHALSALECLAIHRFQPRKNKFKAADRKWTQKCPLCFLHRNIERELRSIFRLR